MPVEGFDVLGDVAGSGATGNRDDVFVALEEPVERNLADGFFVGLRDFTERFLQDDLLLWARWPFFLSAGRRLVRTRETGADAGPLAEETGACVAILAGGCALS